MTGPTRSPSIDEVEPQLGELIRTVLDQPTVPLGQTSLIDLPGFDSVVLVTLVELIEREFAIEFDAEDLVPETFESVEVLAMRVRTRLEMRTHG